MEGEGGLTETARAAFATEPGSRHFLPVLPQPGGSQPVSPLGGRRGATGIEWVKGCRSTFYNAQHSPLQPQSIWPKR